MSLQQLRQVCTYGLRQWSHKLKHRVLTSQGPTANTCLGGYNWLWENGAHCQPRRRGWPHGDFVVFEGSCASGRRQPAQQNTFPRNTRYVYFSRIPGSKILKNAQNRSGNDILFRIFVPQIPYNSVFSFRTFPYESLGTPAVAWHQAFVHQILEIAILQ